MIAWGAVVLMGTVLGVLGGGGAILTVPILIHLFDVPVLQATHYSMLIVGIGAAAGMASHARYGEVALRTGLVFALPSLVGVAVSRSLVLPALPDVFFGVSKGTWVILAFAIVMLFAGLAMLRPGGGSAPVVRPLPLSAGLRGLGVGLVTGFVGAGGGFLVVPALHSLLGLPMRTAVGTSMAIILLNSAIGFSAPYFGNPALVSETPWAWLAQVAAAGVLGIFFGTRIAKGLKPEALKRSFGGFVIAMAAVLVFLELR